MTGVVHLRHCLPYTYVPLRGRTMRLGIATDITPVRFREVEAKDLAPRRTPESGVPTVGHGGTVWGRLPFESDLSWRGAIEACFPGNGSVASLGNELLRLIRRTPFGAVIRLEGVSVVKASPDAADVRLVDDGRERAKRDLQGWIDDNMLVSAGRAYIRLREPLAWLQESVRGGRWVYKVTNGSWAAEDPLCLASPSRVAEHWDFSRRHALHSFGAVPFGHDVGTMAPLEDHAGIFVRDGGRRDDLLFAVNAAPAKLAGSARLLDVYLRHGGHPVPHGLAEIVATLTPLYMRGMFGTIAEPDALDVAETLIAQGERVARMWLESPYRFEPGNAVVVEYLREMVVPAFEAAHAPGDEEALQGMGP